MAGLESRIEESTEKLLATFQSFSIRATVFWLGWVAERHKSLVKNCLDLGHAIASHGYGHVLAYEVGKEDFKTDAEHGKKILEDIIGT